MFAQWLHWLTFPSAKCSYSSFSGSSLASVTLSWILAILTGVICISLMARDAEHFSLDCVDHSCLFFWELCLLVHSPEAPNNQRWALPKAGFWRFIWVSHVSGKVPNHSTAFPSPLAGNWIRHRIAGKSTSSHMRCWCHRQQLYPLNHNTGSQRFSLYQCLK